MTPRLAADENERSSCVHCAPAHCDGPDHAAPAGAPGGGGASRGIDGSDMSSRLAADAHEVSPCVHRASAHDDGIDDAFRIGVPGGASAGRCIEGGNAI